MRVATVWMGTVVEKRSFIGMNRVGWKRSIAV
jgi:hypothetical protein